MGEIYKMSLMISNLRLCKKVPFSNSRNVGGNVAYNHRKYLHPAVITSSLNNGNLTHKRHFSVQNSIDSLARNQTGIFKWLSESTPVEYTQNFLLTVHDISGLPWWATIVCTTVFLRTSITLPLAVYQHYILARLENLKSEMPAIIEELKKETVIAIKIYNWDEKTAKMTYNRSVRKQWNNLIVRDNCHPFKTSLLLLFQIPMWISLSIALRNLVYMLPNLNLDAQLIYTEMTLGGFAFIQNLTEVDSSLIFPFALGIVNLTVIELQILSKVNDPTKLQKVLTNFFRGLSIFMVPIAGAVPSCLVLYWTTSSVYGLFQNMLLLSPKVKRILRIPVTNSELKKPYQHIINGLRNKVNMSPKRS